MEEGSEQCSLVLLVTSVIMTKIMFDHFGKAIESRHAATHTIITFLA